MGTELTVEEQYPYLLGIQIWKWVTGSCSNKQYSILFQNGSLQRWCFNLFYKGSYWYYKYLQLQTHNTTFHSNIARYSDGGAVYIHMQPYTDFETQNWLSITDSRFINNTASQGNGGAIVLSELRQKINCTNPSVINKCQFVNNMARKASGGAIYKNGKIQNWWYIKTSMLITQQTHLVELYMLVEQRVLSMWLILPLETMLQ